MSCAVNIKSDIIFYMDSVQSMEPTHYDAPIITPGGNNKMSPARVMFFVSLIVAAIVIFLVLILESKKTTQEGLTLEQKTEIYEFLKSRQAVASSEVDPEKEAAINAEFAKDNGIEASAEQIDMVSRFLQ